METYIYSVLQSPLTLVGNLHLNILPTVSKQSSLFLNLTSLYRLGLIDIFSLLTKNHTIKMSRIEDSDAAAWISLPRAYILLNVVRIFSILALSGTGTLLGFIVVNSFLTHTVSLLISRKYYFAYVTLLTLLIVLFLRCAFLHKSLLSYGLPPYY